MEVVEGGVRNLKVEDQKPLPDEMIEDPPYEIIRNVNGDDTVKFESGKDKVMDAIVKHDLDGLQLALQDPIHSQVSDLLRIGQDHHQSAPMVLACELGYTDCVKVLLDDGTHPLSHDANGVTGIHKASLHAYLDILLLIFDSAQGDRKIIYGFANHLCFLRRTPLHYAASPDPSPDPADPRKDKFRAVRFLLMNQALPQYPDSNDDLPSSLCADVTIIRMLNVVGRLRLTHEEEHSLYHSSDKEDNDEHMLNAEDYAENLVDAEGIDMSKVPFVPCIKGKYDFLCIRLKSNSHRDKVMEAVLANNPDDLLVALDEAKKDGYISTIDMHRAEHCWPPLVEATMRGSRDCVQHLLRYCANVLACDPYYITSIHAASILAHMEILQMLFDAAEGDKRLTGCLANHITLTGKTPLHFAVQAGSKSNEVVRFLLSKGADPRYADRDMMRPLALCADEDTRETLRKALRKYDGEKD